jgi:malonyl-ACP decarboxylase
MTVVTGIGVVCGLGATAKAFADGLTAGRSAVAEQPGDDKPRYAARITNFPYAGRSPRPVQVAVAAAREAWESADLAARPLPPERVAVVVGGANLTGAALRAAARTDPAYVPPRLALHMQDTDHVATISQALGLKGEGFTVGGASASGNVAIISGARLIESGAADACLVVGAMADPSPVEVRAYANVGALSWSAPSVPFDRSHRGFVWGEGAACLVLERAGARRVPPLARLAGYAQCLDGNSLAAPSEDGEVRVMTRAVERASATPDEIGYVSTHGTGAPLGDVTELRALRKVFGAGSPWLNATKALTGHCLSAAGVVEAVATVIQLRDGFLHASPGLRDPVAPGGRFTGERAEPVRIGLALSNSFGFGGINTCVVLGVAQG